MSSSYSDASLVFACGYLISDLIYLCLQNDHLDMHKWVLSISQDIIVTCPRFIRNLEIEALGYSEVRSLRAC